jgi:hypothetical protein
MAQAEVVEGVIHGKTIELTVDPGLQEGETALVGIRRVKPACTPVERIRVTAGALAQMPSECFADLLEIVRERRGVLTVRSSGDISRG